METTPVTVQCNQCSWGRAFRDQSKADKGLYNHIYRVHRIGEKEMQRRYKMNAAQRRLLGAQEEAPRARRKYTRKPKVETNGVSSVEPALLPSCPKCHTRFWMASGNFQPL